MLLLEIEDLSSDGAGIGKLDGMTFFVKDAIIGDLVRAKVMKLKKTYGFAHLEEILTPSPQRTQPLCPKHRACGGCQIQAMDYKAQLAFKENKVKNNLLRLGGISNAEELTAPILGMEEPYFYRNKAQFPVGRDKNGKPVAGFYAGHSHTIIPHETCYLGSKINEEVLQILLSFMEEKKIPPYDETTGEGLVRHVLVRVGFYTGQIMVCLVLNGRKLPYAQELVEKLCTMEGMTSITLNVNCKNTNVILGEEITLLWGQEFITDRIGDVEYQISPLSFFQVNPLQTKRLYETALSFAGLTGKEIVWDLYCGIGTITLFLARQAKEVYGIEVVPAAIENARENARRNNISNATFFLGKAEEVLPNYAKTNHPDVIVVDPPRKGCDVLCLETMVEMVPERIVYVSCDSATLARDLKFLCEKGYQVEKVQPVDMFPHTVSVETVCLLSKRNTPNHIEMDFNLTEPDITAAESKATY